MATQSGGQWSRESVGLAFSRLGLGIIFVVSGMGKVFAIGPKATGIDAFAGTLTQLGVPLPTVAAWGVGVLELVGGILLLIGLFSRLVAALLAVDMAVATLLVHLPNGFVVSDGGYEYTLVLTLSALGLALSGPGVISLKQLFRRDGSSTT